MEVTEVTEHGVYVDEHGQERWTPPKLAREIGISQSRVRDLNAQGRIEGSVRIMDRLSFPAWPRIKGPDPRYEQDGPIKRYRERWEEMFGPVREAEHITGEGDS